MNKQWLMQVIFFVLLPGLTAVTAQVQWQPDTRLTFNPANSELSYNFKRSLATLPDGSVHTVWHDERNGFRQIFYKRSQNGGLTWDADVALSDTVGEHPTISAANGKVYVAWHRPEGSQVNVVFTRSLDSGNSFDQAVPISSSGAGTHASLAAFADRVYLVWGDVRSGNAEVYVRSSDDGGVTWREEIRLSDVPCESWVPTVAVSGDSVYVAWVDYRDANEEEYFRRSLDGGVTWESIMRLTDDIADSWAPSIAVSGDTIHLTWFDRRDAGVMDGDVEAVLDSAMALLGLPVQPAPLRDSLIYYLPLFEEQRIQDKLQMIWEAAPGWVEDGGDPEELEAILLEFEAMMTLWITGWEIYYKRSTDAGETWGPDTRLTNAPGISFRPSIAISGNELHIVWFDGRDGEDEIYYKYSSDGGITWGPDVRLTDALGNSWRPAVALSDVRVHVVWIDERDGNTEIYYKRGVMTGTVEITNEFSTPSDFRLYQNYPNPFNPVTTLRYDLPERTDLVITIYDILGRKVRTLGRGIEEPGFKSVLWDGTNDVGELVSSGVYLYRIEAGNHVQTQKMILLR